MTVISITLPPELLRKFETFMESKGYYSRSEAFRDAIRNLISESEIAAIQTETVAATIMVTCDHERKDIDLKMIELRHEFDDVVIENVHRHIGEKYCLEIFITQGNNTRILNLINRLRGMHGIQQVKSMFLML
ncbi:MAG: CopG family ribbon-helix-helix protein [Nitrososphaerota archaeon]|jgi:CopG family nickel-responsive transcriptional regulator|nr:CopG family ribbon-helix-helix protein [Nitrososphaerota archaeon]